MDEKIKFYETVALIDASFLNFMIQDIKKYFEATLKRPLQDIDVCLFTSFLMMDTGITEGKNRTQFVFVYDKDSSKLVHHISPSDLAGELNGMAFDNGFGEFAFDAVPTEGMVTRQELYLDLLQLIGDSTDVKKVVAVPAIDEYNDEVIAALKKIKDKEVFLFGAVEPTEELPFHWNTIVFPLMRAFGIKGEELQ